MSLTSEDLRLIRKSFDTVRQDITPASTAFYDALFRRAPDLRSMFRDDLAGQGMKFMTTLTVKVTKIPKIAS